MQEQIPRENGSDAAAPDGPQRPTRMRYALLVLLAASAASAYITRNMAAANTTVAADLRLQPEAMGVVLGGFALGYFWFQVPGGYFGAWFGVRLVLPVCAVLWSLCTYLVARATSGDEMYAARIGLGLSQAALVPCCAKAISDWFPLSQRGIASAAIGASMQIGAVAANGLPAFLIPWMGWRNTYVLFASTGVLWAIAFFAFFRNQPEQHRLVNQAERELIRAGRSPQAAAGMIGMGLAQRIARFFLLGAMMLTSVSAWTICAQGFFRAFGYEFFGTWYPAYLEKARQVSTVDSALMNMLPVACYGTGAIVGGLLIDYLLVRTGSKRISRSGTACVALLLCAVCIWTAAQIASSWGATAIISLGTFFAALAGPCTWAATMDISGRNAAVMMGVMNMVGNIGSYYSPQFVGRLIQKIEETGGDWNLVLYLFVGINLAAAFFWALVNPDDKIRGAEEP